MRASLLWVTSALLLGACSSNDTGGSTGTPADGGITSETGGGDTGTGPADTGTDPADTGTDAAIGCGTVANVGTPVPETAGVGAYPTPAGGSLADGTYVLTKFEIYPPGSIDAYKRKQTLVVAGGKIDFVSQTDADPEVRFGGDVTVTGTKLVLAVKCPATTSLEKPFSATATEIKIWDTDGSTLNEVHTFTKK